MGGGAAAEFNKVWGFALAFNLIKCAANTVITLLLYKRLSVLLHKYVLKEYNRRMEYISKSAKDTVKEKASALKEKAKWARARRFLQRALR